ncbi:MAG: hypothetical protein WDM92_00350 [Caulobacteraceae bacterium]
MIPVTTPAWSAEEVAQELENNAQSILAMSCAGSTRGSAAPRCPTIHDVGLMEDRATLRISSQHIGNWLMLRRPARASRCWTC